MPALICCISPQLTNDRKHRVRGGLKAKASLQSGFCELEHLADQFLLLRESASRSEQVNHEADLQVQEGSVRDNVGNRLLGSPPDILGL
jgi:hypothetical protein